MAGNGESQNNGWKWRINIAISLPSPPSYRSFSLLPNGGKWDLPAPPLRSPNKKCILGDFGPRISHLSIENAKIPHFPPLPPLCPNFHLPE